MNGLPTTTLIQSIVAIVFGVLGIIFSLVGLVFGIIGIGLIGASMGFETYQSMATILTGVVGLLVALSMLVTSIAVLAGGAMALAKKTVGLLITSGILAILHLVLFDILWNIVAQIINVGSYVMDGAPMEVAIGAGIGSVVGLIVGVILAVIKVGFWGWTVWDARKVKAQLGDEGALGDLNPAMA